jgi:nucleotide-binding universal stress UspA family protein
MYQSAEFYQSGESFESGIQKILVPLDGSTAAEQVFPVIRRFATRLRGKVELTLMHCFEPSAPPENLRKVGAYLLSRAEALLEGMSSERLVSTSTLMVSGDSAEQIIEAGRHLDLIIMASGGSGWSEGGMYGNVAARVTECSKTRVVVVPTGTGSSNGETPPAPLSVRAPMLAYLREERHCGQPTVEADRPHYLKFQVFQTGPNRGMEAGRSAAG